MNTLKSQRIVFGLFLIFVTRLCFQFNLDYLFWRTDILDALMVALPALVGIGLSMHLLWGDFMNAKTWQAVLACAGGLYLGVMDLDLFIRFVRVVDGPILGLAIGFGVGGAMYLVFALMGLMTVAAFGWVLWNRLSVTLKQSQKEI